MNYTIESNLLGAIRGLLDEMPARASRGVLNALDATINEQDQRRQGEAREALKASLRDEIAAVPPASAT